MVSPSFVGLVGNGIICDATGRRFLRMQSHSLNTVTFLKITNPSLANTSQ